MNFELKSEAIIFCVVFFCFLLLAFSLDKVYASITTNDKWTIEIKDVNITNTIPQSRKEQLITQQRSATSLSPLSFSFSISNFILDYGILSPTNQIYRTSNLRVSNAGLKEFSVVVYEDHPLKTTEANLFIPDTTCDNGSCSQLTAAAWINTLTYGFGYRCDNVNDNNCSANFAENNYYKQFPDNSKNEKEQIVMSGNNSASNHEIQITYKVNTSPTQPGGSYQNTITYIAVPEY